MKRLAYFFSACVPCAIVACGSQAPAGDISDASAPSRSFEDAQAGDDGGPAPLDAASDGGADGALPDAASLSCAELAAAHDAELANAKLCNLNAFANECTTARPLRLGCDCLTFVNVSKVGTLDAIAAAWSAKGCTAGCPDVLCKVLGDAGSCAATMPPDPVLGKCVDDAK